MTPVPDRKVRALGVALIVLALLALLGAFTGLDAAGAGPRVTLGVLGGLMLIVGALLTAAKAPALASVDLDDRGLVVSVAGQAEDVVPWDQLRAFGLRRIGPNERGEKMGLRPGGLVVTADCPTQAVPHGLKPFAIPQADGISRLVLGLPRTKALALRRRIPTFAEQLRRLPPTG